MRTGPYALVASLVLALASNNIRSATLTWNGSASTDWNNPTNWTPQQVPTNTDHVIINSGSVIIPADGTFSNMDWSGGTISGALNVASNGVLNVNGTSYLDLGGALTNAGTVNWTNGQLWLNDYPRNDYPNAGPIVNLTSGVWNIQCDQTLEFYDYYGYYPTDTNAYFENEGLVHKMAGSGTTTFGNGNGVYAMFFENTGMVEADEGTISFQGGGTIGGAFNAAGGATIAFANGNFTDSGAALSGPGTNEFTGNSLTLSNNVIPNLQLLGGAVILGPNFQGGTITNLTLAASTLSGNYTVTGTFNCGAGVSGSLQVAGGAMVNWSGGTISGALNVASNGVLNVNGTSYLDLGSALTNAGTVNWTGGGIYLNTYYNNYPNAGPMVNLANGVWNIQCDQNLEFYYYYGDYSGNPGPNAYFENEGLVHKTAGSGTTAFGSSSGSGYAIFFENSGTVEADEGTISFQGGGTIGGAFNAAGGATIAFANGSFTDSGAALSGPGTNKFTGNSLTLSNNVIAGLQLLGGTVILGPNFQGGTITNLTLASSTLNGNYTVTGTFNCGAGVSGSLQVAGGALVNWSGGTISGALNVASNAVLNLNGTSAVYLGGALTNAGTVNWTGGGIYLNTYYNNYPNAGPMVNLDNGVWNIQCDQNLEFYYYYGDYSGNPGPNAYFENEGLVLKTVGSGTTAFGSSSGSGYAIFFENSGTVEADAGTISFLGGYSDSSSANLSISLGGATPGSGYGNISFSTPVSFDGTFTVSTRNGYLPTTNGTTFQVLSYPSETNSFTCMGGLDLGSGILLQADLGPTSLTLTAASYTNNAIVPFLLINPTYGGVYIQWQDGFPTWTLQTTTNLSSPVWTTVSNECNNQATVPISAPRQYFRLHNGN